MAQILRARTITFDSRGGIHLSGSTGGFAAFNGGSANTGQQYIVNLVLPDTFISVEGDTGNYKSYFMHYTALKEISGANVAVINFYAFYGKDNNTGNLYLQNLTRVSFPAATGISSHAFAYCESLTSASFPAAASIGNNAFYSCESLTSASFPAATSIGDRAFYFCTSLASVTLGTITDADFSDFEPFFGDLRDVYFAQPEGLRAGTYITPNPELYYATWTKQ